MTQELVTTTFQVEDVIAAWLQETFDTKSRSAKTQTAYQDTITSFRTALQEKGLDLDTADRATLVETAQAWAGQRAENAKPWHKGKPIADATYNQRLAIVSSFYSYVQEHLRLRAIERENPLTFAKRRKVQAYASAEPLEPETVAAALASVDRSTTQGKRDYALLAVMVQVGRRGNEIVSLRLEHVTLSGQGRQPKVTLHFDHCKGAKKLRDTLDEDTAAVFLDYLHAVYGPNLLHLEKDAPVWVSFSRQNQGHAISTHALNDICATYLGTSKIHVTRHTFAYTQELEGAPLSEIQHRLGHERIETTATYVKSVKSSVNPYASRAARRFGIRRYREDNTTNN